MQKLGINVMWVHLKSNIPKESFGRMLRILPIDWHPDVMKYHHQEDRERSLAGKILLLELFNKVCATVTGPITYSQRKKPIIPTSPRVDFSISHSGRVVVCALTTEGMIGIDVEKYRVIDFNSVKSAMSERQWFHIHQASNPSEVFFEMWTLKECIAKATGLGLYLSFREIDIGKKLIVAENQNWSYKKLQLKPNYICNLAHNQSPRINIKIQTVDHLNDFLPF